MLPNPDLSACKILARGFLWYCCLNPRERAVFDFCAFSWQPERPYVELAVWDAFMTGIGYDLSSDRYDAVVVMTRVGFGFVPNPDGEPLAVVFFDTVLTVELIAYRLCDQSTCTDGCFYRRYAGL